MRKCKGLVPFFKLNRLLYVGGFAAVIIIAAGLFVSGDAGAKVHGRCDNCHTMHNSQNGVDMVVPVSIKEESGGSITGTCAACHLTPRENLLTRSCIGCHALNATGGGIGDLGDGQDVPQVYYAQNASDSLAAGNFSFVATDSHNGHNVHGFPGIGADPEAPWPPLPPGYDANFDYSDAGYDSIIFPPDGEQIPNSWQITCAGTYGCHGNRDIIRQGAATAGSHHASDSMLKFGGIDTNLQGITSGNSYRFLSGVWGGEDADWEATVSVSDHNEYQGQVLADREGQIDTDVNTMSEFCAGCHGNFHASSTALRASGQGLGTASPWIRHPTDVLLPAEVPYSDYTSYKLSAPVARTSIPNASQEAVPGGTAIVFCLSCHRAHGSDQFDILRFSYADMITGAGATGEGCFACHGDK